MKERIIVIVSSHLSEEENSEFKKHVSNTIGVPHETFTYINQNQYSLSEVYNIAINDHHSDNAIMIFCHNDIVFETKDWGKKILNHFNRNDYQIIGVAGVTELHEHGCWWLTKNRDHMNTTKMIGIVNHDNGIRKWETRYSEPHFGIKPVILVDGLFIAVDTSNIEHKFDESYKGFHYYDISFCIPNYLDGCNVGVITDVRITHKSIGVTNQEWEKNRLQFINEYKDELPIYLEE